MQSTQILEELLAFAKRSSSPSNRLGSRSPTSRKSSASSFKPAKSLDLTSPTSSPKTKSLVKPTSPDRIFKLNVNSNSEHEHASSTARFPTTAVFHGTNANLQENNEQSSQRKHQKDKSSIKMVSLVDFLNDNLEMKNNSKTDANVSVKVGNVETLGYIKNSPEGHKCFSFDNSPTSIQEPTSSTPQVIEKSVIKPVSVKRSATSGKQRGKADITIKPTAVSGYQSSSGRISPMSSYQQTIQQGSKSVKQATKIIENILKAANKSGTISKPHVEVSSPASAPLKKANPLNPTRKATPDRPTSSGRASPILVQRSDSLARLLENVKISRDARVNDSNRNALRNNRVKTPNHTRPSDNQLKSKPVLSSTFTLSPADYSIDLPNMSITQSRLSTISVPQESLISEQEHETSIINKEDYYEDVLRGGLVQKVNEALTTELNLNNKTKNSQSKKEDLKSGVKKNSTKAIQSKLVGASYQTSKGTAMMSSSAGSRSSAFRDAHKKETMQKIGLYTRTSSLLNDLLKEPRLGPSAGRK